VRDRACGVDADAPATYDGVIMTKDELTAWALANGWQMIAGCPSLTKPSSPKEAIVRMKFMTTVVNLEIKKPAGKWEKVGGAAYAKIEPEPETGQPMGIGLEAVPSIGMLMQDNKDRVMFAKLGGGPKG
jgi:hypothetical protein